MVTLLPRLIYTLLLPHFFAVIGILDPLHVIALALPLLLAYLLPHLAAFLLMNSLTHFFGCWPAHFLVLSLALGHPLGHALRRLPLLVLVLIHVMVLGPALRRMVSAPMTMFT